MAQITPASTTMTKEEKAKMREQQNADLVASFKEAMLTDDQTAKAKEILDVASKQGNELKKNTTLTDAEKEDQKKKLMMKKMQSLKSYWVINIKPGPQ